MATKKRLRNTQEVPRREQRRGGVFLITAVILLLNVSGSVAADAFVVIVNQACPVSTLSQEQISDLFFRRQAKWPDGTEAAPVDLGESSPVRTSFSKAVLGKGVAAVKSYWQRMIFSGRAVPPPEKASPADVMAFVRSQRGAIGYVPQGTPLDPGVKALTVSP